MKAQRSSPIPLYLQIEEDLRARIRAGELRALDRVRSELELAEAFGVSRMTARKSLDRLVTEGVLFRRAGKGTYVAPTKIEHSASTRLSFSSAMRSLGLTVETRVLAAGMKAAPPRVGTALRQPEGAQVAYVRRLRGVRGEPAAIHLAYLPARLATVLDHDLTASLNDAMASVGARVAHARDTIEAVAATPKEAALLGLVPDAPLIRIQGVGLSVDLEPLRYTEAVYRADRFRFRLASDADEPDLHVELKRAADDSS